MPPPPYMIALAGPSCSGKTTLAHHLATRLSGTLLSLDSYYRDLSHLPPDQRQRCNFDAPQALDHQLLGRHLQHLAWGLEVERPVYLFADHVRAPQTEKVRAGDYLIVEGLFSLYWEEIRNLFKTKVFIATADHLCLERREQRDIRERGRTPASVQAQYADTVRPMYERYIAPTRDCADLIVDGADLVPVSIDRILAHIANERA